MDAAYAQAKKNALKKYFGYTSFREGQEPIVDALLGRRDVMAVMPTGAGKSLCFQLPALLMPGITLVISPLISLMKDQVRSLGQAGVPAAYLNSSLTERQYYLALENAIHGKYKLIYVAPERLDTPRFLEFALYADISMVAVDEAHCVSQWGQDFRPSYLAIPDFIRKLPVRPAVGAFTATATPEVREDIIKMLQLAAPDTFVTGFDRKNLYFEVQKPADKKAALLDIVRKYDGESGIVYAATRKNVEEVQTFLTSKKIEATRYHAGLSQEERHANQEDFIYGRARIMVATNAFGMGIDKSDVRFVVHYNMPKDLESYYQEAGRAGRDGGPADCILLYGSQDVATNRFLIKNGEQEDLDEQERARLQQLQLERLKKMTFYCFADGCLRRYILEYFGEQAAPACGNCCNCRSRTEQADATEDAKKILQCVRAVRERFGIGVITDILRGMHNERTARSLLTGSALFGSLSRLNAREVRERIEVMLSLGVLDQSEGDYPVLTLGPNAEKVLCGQSQVILHIIHREKGKAAPKNEGKQWEGGGENLHPGLYARLRELRTALAREQHVPPYVIFTNQTLEDMCRRLPADREAFAEVTGVGSRKCEKYGDAFLAAIALWRSEKMHPGEIR